MTYNGWDLCVARGINRSIIMGKMKVIKAIVTTLAVVVRRFVERFGRVLASTSTRST